MSNASERRKDAEGRAAGQVVDLLDKVYVLPKQEVE